MKPVAMLLVSLLYMSHSLAQQTVGLFTHTTASEDGYVLFAPIFSRTTYLMDKCGKEIHTWQSAYTAGNSAYLLQDGSLLRAAQAGNPVFSPGGIIEHMDWNGSMLWSYAISSTSECQHHDVCMMPNGHILALVWEVKSQADAISSGRDSAMTGQTLWTEKVVELEPIGSNAANIVWEWNIWDHLVQDKSSSLMNYGVISDHPELIDINQYNNNPTNPDWVHLNAIDYNADLDEIMLSSYFLNELWVIDHGTTMAEVSTHRGGRHNKGGDLLYRWGNSEAYGRGTPADRMLYSLHNAHWIAKGLPDAGKIMIYNNGLNRPDSDYSTIDVIDPPLDPSGNYQIVGSQPYGPISFYWEYKAPHATDFYASFLSGAQRLPGGNTLVCEGSKGSFFEIDVNKNVVWRYVSPVSGNVGPVSQGVVPQQSLVFRCTQYPASYEGFAGRTLTAGAPIELNPLSYSCLLDNTTGTGTHVQSVPAYQATNPFSNSIRLSYNGTDEHIHVALINYTGMICGQWEFHITKGGSVNINVPQSLTPGLYLLRIDDGSKQTTLRLQHS